MAALTIRSMLAADVPFGMALKAQFGWNQSEADWRMQLALNPDGCFVAEREGRSVGTVTTTRHGAELAWVGMMLVDTAEQGRGIGRALLRHACGRLAANGVRTVALDATPAGKLLYASEGFVACGKLSRMSAVATPVEEDAAVEDAAAVPGDDLAAFDLARCGYPRGGLLAALRGLPGAFGWIIRDTGGAISGYLLARPGSAAWYLGPWLADSDDAAAALLSAALHSLSGASVVADVFAGYPSSRELLTRHGFTVQRSLTRMASGPAPAPFRPEALYGIAGPEIG